MAALGLELRDLFDAGAGAQRIATRTPNSDTPAPEIEELGDPTPTQISYLVRERRITRAATLESVGARWLRVRFWNPARGAWRAWGEWLGVPTLDGWKLWAIDGCGAPRVRDGKLERINVGAVSLLLSPDVRQRNGGAVERLFDVEGESDLLAMLDAGMGSIVATTGGASALTGHERHADRLRALEPREIVVLGDRDRAGREGAERRAAWWQVRGVPVRVLELPAELPDGGDLRDFLMGWRAGDGTEHEPLGGSADLDALADAAALRLAPDTTTTREKRSAAIVDVDLAELGFTGDRLRALRDRPEPRSPLPGWLDPEPGLHVVPGRPKSGKTTLAASLAQAWAIGAAPWPGVPALPGTRALILSREQTATRIDTTLRRLAAHTDDREGWEERLTIVARDAELSPEARRLLLLDDEGLDRLSAHLRAARDRGRPFGLVVLDSLSRLKPADVEENDNDGLTRWLDRIEWVASGLGVYALLIHHQGHAIDGSRSEARSAGRGASAIAAVARAVWLVERVPETPRHRRVKLDGNAILPREVTLEVAAAEAEAGRIDHFRPVDALAEYDPRILLPANGAGITTSELARRLDPEARNGKRESGTAVRLACALRDKWHRAGLIDVQDGARGSKLIALRSAS